MVLKIENTVYSSVGVSGFKSSRAIHDCIVNIDESCALFNWMRLDEMA
jgi:hypothetical protein